MRRLCLQNVESILGDTKKDLPKRTGPYHYMRVIFTPPQQPGRQPDVRWAHGRESKMRSSCLLTTDTAAQVGTYLTAFLHSELDEATNTLLVEHLEWVNLQDLLVEIYRQE